MSPTQSQFDEAPQWRLTRRAFLRTTAAAVALSLSPRLYGADDPGRPLYAFPLLGDLHFDRMAHHDLDWVKREKGGDMRQIDGYVETTAKYTPRLFARIRQAIGDSKVPVPFVLHVGDLVEGLCGSRDLHTTQCREAIAAVEAAKFGVPVLMAKGNHDVTGPGAPDAFNDVLLPWISGQAKQDLRAPAASYTLTHGDDLFVVFDAYKPDLDWLDRALAAAPKAARTFFMI